jgi:polygalacturonase
MPESRRAFLLRAGALAAPWLLARTLAAEAAPRFTVRGHGARGDGRTKDTRAIQAAIDAAAPAGETVLFPPGEYVSGTLRLRSGITLRLDAGATLLASPDDADFDPREEIAYETFADRETSDFTFALLQGRRVSRISIVGPGRIDGNRTSREGPKPIALKECHGIQIRELTIANAGNYNISLLGCEGVEIRDVRIQNGYSDGIDPDCCRNVRIANCHIESRDDALVLKTSRALGVPRPTEDVTVTNCHLVTLHNALKLGTESSGDFRRIVFRDCTIDGQRHAWKGELSSGISLQSVDGGTLERVTVSNIRMANIRAPIFVRLARRGRGQEVRTPGALRDVSISNVVATGASAASSIMGIPGHPVTRISLRNIRVAARGGGAADLVSLDVPEMERMYPDAFMFGDLPAYGLYGRHVVGLTVDGIDLRVGRSDARPAIVLDDVGQVDVRAIRATPAADGGATVWLHSVRDGVLRDLRPHVTGKSVVRVSGKRSARLRLLGADVPQVDGHTVTLDADVAATALQVGTEVTPR